MRVDEEKYPWQPGGLIVFDDTYDHEVRNDTPQERVVLLFDFERPMKFWGRVANKLFIQIVKLTAYYNDPKRKMKSFEDQFELATRNADKLLENMNS